MEYQTYDDERSPITSIYWSALLPTDSSDTPLIPPCRLGSRLATVRGRTLSLIDEADGKVAWTQTLGENVNPVAMWCGLSSAMIASQETQAMLYSVHPTFVK